MENKLTQDQIEGLKKHHEKLLELCKEVLEDEQRKKQDLIDKKLKPRAKRNEKK